VEKRLLGLDVGSRTIGVAVSDPLGITAQGVGVWRRKGREKDLAYLKEVCEAYDVGKIVVGLPLRTDSRKGPEAEEVERFAREIEAATGKPVVLWDERFTTRIAQRALIEAGLRRERRRELVDMTAAVLILQGDMERSETHDRARRDDPGG